MTGVDLRGFRYGLAAARERAGHRVDAAAAHLGSCQQELAQAKDSCRELESALESHAQQWRHAPGASVRPQLAVIAARQMASMNAKLALAQQAIAAKERAVEEARRLLQTARTAREAFDRHREAALEDYRRDVSRAQQAALDHDWLARLRWLDVEGVGAPGEPSR